MLLTFQLNISYPFRDYLVICHWCGHKRYSNTKYIHN